MLARAKVNEVCTSCKVTVECKWMAPTVAHAAEDMITGLRFDKPGLPAGYVTGKVKLANKPVSATTAIQLYISIQKKLPIAAKQFSSGEPITAKTITWQWKDISGLNRQPVSSLAGFKGQQAARVIRKGSVFFASDLQGPQTIQPGDPVAMQFRESSVRIQIDCIAREAKSIGQQIRLYSKETGRNYIGKIINKNKIVWIRTL